MWKLKANKTKLYKLVSEFEALPPMRETVFSKQPYSRLYTLSWTNGHGRQTEVLLIADFGVVTLFHPMLDGFKPQTLSLEELQARGLVEECAAPRFDSDLANDYVYETSSAAFTAACKSEVADPSPADVPEPEEQAAPSDAVPATSAPDQSAHGQTDAPEDDGGIWYVNAYYLNGFNRTVYAGSQQDCLRYVKAHSDARPGLYAVENFCYCGDCELWPDCPGCFRRCLPVPAPSDSAPSDDLENTLDNLEDIPPVSDDLAFHPLLSPADERPYPADGLEDSRLRDALLSTPDKLSLPVAAVMSLSDAAPIYLLPSDINWNCYGASVMDMSGCMSPVAAAVSRPVVMEIAEAYAYAENVLAVFVYALPRRPGSGRDPPASPIPTGGRSVFAVRPAIA